MVFGAAPGRGLDTPVPDTLEGAMAALPAVGYLFSRRPPGRGRGRREAGHDHSPEQGYLPLEPDHLDGVDGVLFVAATA